MNPSAEQINNMYHKPVVLIYRLLQTFINILYSLKYHCHRLNIHMRLIKCVNQPNKKSYNDMNNFRMSSEFSCYFKNFYFEMTKSCDQISASSVKVQHSEWPGAPVEFPVHSVSHQFSCKCQFFLWIISMLLELHLSVVL